MANQPSVDPAFMATSSEDLATQPIPLAKVRISEFLMDMSNMNNLNRRVVLAAALCTALSGATAFAQEAAGEADSEAMAASTMKVKLRGDMELSGTPADLDVVPVNSLFGEAKLPLHTVAGIRFAQNADEQTVIVLQNGDVITGEPNLETIKVVSEWGEANINMSYIESITFRSDLAWAPVNTGSGQRWRLQRIR